MRAISLWQPWATAIAIGAKRIETRSWSTDYRGLLAIHAAKRLNKGELIHYACCWNWCAALAPLGKRMGDSQSLWDLLPFGAIVATCELVDCRPTGDFTYAELKQPRWHAGQPPDPVWNESQMGNFDLGRFGWVLSNVRALPNPLPFKGRQGFFNVPDEVLANGK